MTSGVWSEWWWNYCNCQGQAVAIDNDIWSKVDKQGKRLLDITNNGVPANDVFRKTS